MTEFVPWMFQFFSFLRNGLLTRVSRESEQKNAVENEIPPKRGAFVPPRLITNSVALIRIYISRLYIKN